MRIGGAVILLAVGAILTFAIRWNHTHGFNLNAVGIILMVVAGIWLLVELVVYTRRSNSGPPAPPANTTDYRY